MVSRALKEKSWISKPTNLNYATPCQGVFEQQKTEPLQKLYVEWQRLPAVNTLNCDHKLFPHGISLRIGNFD